MNYDGTDSIDVVIGNSELIEIEFSDIGEVSETLNFKFKIDSNNQLN